MTKAEKARLRGRWMESDLRAIMDALRQGTVHSLALGRTEHDGTSYVDLRGLPITEVLEGEPLHRLDLSASEFVSSRQIVSRLAECRVLEADLDGAFIGTLSNSVFDGAVVGHFGTTEISNCSFRKTRFQRSRSYKATFRRCDFSSAIFRTVMFDHCTFDRCIWADAVYKLASFNRPHFIGTQPTIPDVSQQDSDIRLGKNFNMVERPRFSPAMDA